MSQDADVDRIRVRISPSGGAAFGGARKARAEQDFGETALDHVGIVEREGTAITKELNGS